MNFCAEYIREIRKSLEKGDATEHTHRAALETLLEACGKEIDATNEPRRIACGAPDFNITRKGVPIGHVETKDIGVNLDEMERGKGPNGEQFKRYSTLPNWVLTDYLEFRWYAAGEKRLTVRVADFDGKGRIKAAPDGDEKLLQLLTAFYHEPALTVGTARELAQRMAGMTRIIRDLIIASFTHETEETERKLVQEARKPYGGAMPSRGPWLHNWLAAFRETLIPDLTETEFADMFAQTLAYGLFAARIHAPANREFSREMAAFNLPKTNPFLRKLFAEIAGVDMPDTVAWAVDDLVNLLRHADMAEILKDFGKGKGKEDPVVHFYETFLAALGGELVALHLMESPQLNDLITEFPAKGTDTVEKVQYNDKDGRVWINPTQYFGGVPAAVWNFHIGGYQVCEKWLKDRKGRKLTYEDTRHYQRIVVALNETIRDMTEIDEVIRQYGDWPTAFSPQ
jgi:hypothetical protein